jgi:hypothetical protein
MRFLKRMRSMYSHNYSFEMKNHVTPVKVRANIQFRKFLI